MTLPLVRFGNIMDALRHNLERITVANGFYTDVVLVDETNDEPVRPENITGPIITISDVVETYSYRPADFVDATITYVLNGWLQSAVPIESGDPVETPAELKERLRKFAIDLWIAYRYDINLSIASAALMFGGTALCKEHRIRQIERQVSYPDAMVIVQGEMRYEFRSDSTS